MPAGRPTKMTPETLDKLRYAFSIGCTDAEACLYADISEDLLYKYQRENPEYIKEKEKLKKNPCLKAKQVVMDSIEGGDKSDAKWYLERRDPDFKPKKETDMNLNPHEDFVKLLIDKGKG
jgi:hypothetical protein